MTGTTADDKGLEQDATVLEAATRFEGLLGGDAPKTKPRPEVDRTGGERLADARARQDGDAGETVEQTEAEQDASESQESFEVEIDGEKRAVSLDDLVAAYHKNSGAPDQDEAAEAARAETRRIEDEAQQTWARKIQAADDYLQFLLDADPVVAEAKKVDWEKLYEEDSDKYHRMRAALDTRTQRYQAFQEKRRAIAEQASRETVTREAKALNDKLPISRDQAKWGTEAKAIGEYLLSAGYELGDIRNLSDHRAVIIARKAMMYDRLEASKAETARKVAAVPKVVKPGTKTTSKVDEARDRRTQTLNQFKKSQRGDDLAAAFYERI